MKRLLAALLCSAAVSPALSQTFPGQLPVNTVLGNVGVAPAPATAVPISRITTNVLMTAFSGAGDNSTDNHLPYENAVAFIQGTGNGCGKITFGPGIWLTTLSYDVRTCISVDGAGPGATFLQGPASAPLPLGYTMLVYGTFGGTGSHGVTGPIPTYNINAPALNATTITLPTAADTSNFTNGGTIALSGGFHGTNFPYPFWHTTITNINAGTGVITLAEGLPLSGITALKQSTFTVTIATPGVFTWAGHGLAAGTPVYFTTTGALPTGLTANTTYFVANDANLTGNTFAVSDTAAHALAGTNQINTTGTQSGTQTATKAVTITIAAPGVITNTGHGLAAGSGIVFQNSGGALPTGLVAGKTYYIAQDANLTTNTFDVSDTYAHALAGANQVTTSGSQSGSQTAQLANLVFAQPITLVKDVTISDLTLLGTTVGAMQSNATFGVTFRNVDVKQGATGSVTGTYFSIAGARNAMVVDSRIDNYLDCLSCFDSAFLNNVVNKGKLVFEGGTQNSLMLGNRSLSPFLNGAASSGIDIADDAQFNRILGNSIQNIAPGFPGLVVGQNNDAMQGGNIVCNNTFTGSDATGSPITIETSDGNVICDNLIYNASVGIRLAAGATNTLVENNKIYNTATHYVVDAAASIVTPKPFATTFSNGATPAVGFGYPSITQSGAVNVIGFTGGSPSTDLYATFADANSTIISGSGILLFQNSPFNPPPGTIMHFINVSGIWVEVSRSQQSTLNFLIPRGLTVGGSLLNTGISTIGGLTKLGTVCVSTTFQLYYSATTC